MATWSDAKPRGTIPVAQLDDETRDQLLFLKDLISQWARFNDANSADTELFGPYAGRAGADFISDNDNFKIDAFGNLTLVFADDGAVGGPVATLDRLSVSPLASDFLARLVWQGRDTASGAGGYAEIRAQIVDPTFGQTDGRLILSTTQAGVDLAMLTLDTTLLITNAANINLNALGDFTLIDVDPTSVAGPVMRLARLSPSPSSLDLLGRIEFPGRDAALAVFEYAAIEGIAEVITAGLEEGRLRVQLAEPGGSFATVFDVLAIGKSGIGMGARLKDGTGITRPVGMNIAPNFFQNSDDSFDLAHNGYLWDSSTAAVVTWTVPLDTTIPSGATYMIIMRGSGNLIIAQGAGVTLNFQDGSGNIAPTGDRTLVRGAAATLYKRTDSLWEIWGNGIS